MKKVQGKPLPLGTVITEEGVNFSVAVPEGAECELLLYAPGQKTPHAAYRMEEALGSVYYLAVEGEISGMEYQYRINGKYMVDPYAKALSGCEKWGASPEERKENIRGLLYAKNYDWQGDQPLKLPAHKVIAYGLHVRGFTKDASSKVSQKGTFEGVIEKIPYLKELGINQIQCMPVYEFNECGIYPNYWGYGDAFYFTPKSAYSASGDGVKSLKDMVRECHKNGIEVVLEMAFERNRPKQMMEECLRYYRMEYHVDGFIVNPENAPMDGICGDPILRHTKILKYQNSFQNVMRRFLKGDEGMVNEVMYWLRHTSSEEGVFNYITSHNGFTLWDLVSYDGKHNESNGEQNQDGENYNFSWNCGAEGPSRKKSVTEMRWRQIRNAFLLVLLAQGTPCILAGDEFGNSQKGNNNAYCQDNPVGWVNWRKSESAEKQYVFVRELIRLRKTYGGFCPEKEMIGQDTLSCGVPDVSYHGENAWRVPSEVSSRQLGVYYSGAASGGTDCFVIYNMHWLEHTYALPALSKNKSWNMIASTEQEIMKKPERLKDQKSLRVKARTIVVLIGR